MVLPTSCEWFSSWRWLLVLRGCLQIHLAQTTTPPDWVVQLRAAKCAPASTSVQDMYEDLPYPHRDPANEIPGRPAELDVPSTPAAISHQLHAGTLDFAKLGRPFRILVSGGGTGDATVMLATSFWAAQIPVDITHVDLSSASIEVARQRIAIHGFDGTRRDVKISFLRMSIFELTEEEHGLFDFINAVGMIHHLPSPAEGLKSLSRLLRPEGGLFIMVYGELGRTGVYDFQDLWRLTGLSRREFLNGPIQALIKKLPEGNRLGRNRRMMTQKVKKGDPTTLSDLLLHSCDHAYTVASILELLAVADLQLVDFADPDKYAMPSDLESSVADVVARIPDRFQRFYFAELLRGDIFIHSFWAASQLPSRAPTQLSAESVLCPYWRFVGYKLKLADGDAEKCLSGGQVDTSWIGCSLYIDNVKHTMLPCIAMPWLQEIDCERSIADLHDWLQEQTKKTERSSNAAPLSSSLDDSVKLAQTLFDGISTQGERKIFIVRQPFHFRHPPDREKIMQKILWEVNWDSVKREQDGNESSVDSSFQEL